MKKLFALTLSICVCIVGLAQPPKVAADKGVVFGEPTTALNAVSVEELTSLISAKEDGNKKMEVKLKGVVTDVCTMEGCWIKVQSPNGKMMVKMKDHKFTVPLALNGKTVVIDGIAEEKITSVDQLRQYAEDAGKSKEEIDAIKEPKKEIIVNARGLLVL